MLLSRCLVAAACVGRAPPVYLSAADELVTTLIDQLKTSADATETLAALEEVGGFDALPDGRWAALSFDLLSTRLEEYGTKLLSPCELRVSEDGPEFMQNELYVSFVVSAGDSAPVRVTCKGVASFRDDDIGVVFLSAIMLPVSDVDGDESGFDAVEDALAPHLPPGAIRARLPLIHLDESICALKDAKGGVVVLQREEMEDEEPDDIGEDVGPALQAAALAAAEAKKAGGSSAGRDGSAGAVVDAVVSSARDIYLGEDEEDDDERGRELWVGSPY